jgi:hypothetical protein
LELGRKFGAQFGPNSYVLILNYYCEKFQVEKVLEVRNAHQFNRLKLIVVDFGKDEKAKHDDTGHVQQHCADVFEVRRLEKRAKIQRGNVTSVGAALPGNLLKLLI